MDTLRWILLVFGLILIAVVYFSGRRRRPDVPGRREPELDDDAGFHAATGGEPAAAASGEGVVAEEGPQEDIFDFERLLADQKDAPPAASRSVRQAQYPMLLEDEYVVIHLLAAAGSPGASGSRLYSALSELDFELAEDGVFHYRESECPLLAVNAFKPGTFPPDPDEFVSRGVSFILRLSRAARPLDAFDEMATLAYELGSMLNLQLFDMQRSSLTRQTIAFLEEAIGDYQRRRGA